MRGALLLWTVLLAGCSGQTGGAPFSGYAEADLVLLAAPSAGRLQTLDVQRGSHVEWFEGNFQDYEKDKMRRLGQDSIIPHRVKYKKLTR